MLLLTPLLLSPPTVDGLARIWAEPTLESGPHVLTLSNPHRARSILRLEGIELGLVDPLGRVTVTGIRAGAWSATWIGPTGFERPERVTTAPHPPESSRSSSR